MFIHQAAYLALNELGTPRHVSEVYRYIVKNNYYDFGAKDPENALAIQLSRRSCNVFISESIADKIFYRAAPATYGLKEWLEIDHVNDGPSSLLNMPFESDVHEILYDRRLSTEREAFLFARLGQGTFRSGVLKQWNNRCAITGASIAVRASHIKPWRSSTDAERLIQTMVYHLLPLWMLYSMCI